MAVSGGLHRHANFGGSYPQGESLVKPPAWCASGWPRQARGDCPKRRQRTQTPAAMSSDEPAQIMRS